MVIPADRVETPRSAPLPQHTAVAVVGLVLALQQQALAVAVAPSVLREQALAQQVITEAVAVAMVWLQPE